MQTESQWHTVWMYMYIICNYIYISVTLTHSDAFISDPDVHRIQRLEHCHTEAICRMFWIRQNIHAMYHDNFRSHSKHRFDFAQIIGTAGNPSANNCRYMNASKRKWMSMPIGNIPHQRHLDPCQIEKNMSTETFSIHTVRILCKEMKKSESIQLLWMEPCSP